MAAKDLFSNQSIATFIDFQGPSGFPGDPGPPGEPGPAVRTLNYE